MLTKQQSQLTIRMISTKGDLVAKSRKSRDNKFGPVYEQLREGLMKRIGNVDSQVLISVASLDPARLSGKIVGRQKQFFSDWPDTYNRDTWYKTWAKAENFASLPPEAIVSRKIGTKEKASRRRSPKVGTPRAK
jgi:hypothetical protein